MKFWDTVAILFGMVASAASEHGWDQALKEAIEQAHGIGVKND